MHFAFLSKLESEVSKTKEAAKGAAQYAKPETFLDKSFQNGQKSKNNRGEAATSFMRGRLEFGSVRNVRDVYIVCGTGNVWNIFDVCGTRNIGSVRGMSDIRCVCRLSTRCTIRDNRAGCAMCRLLFFRQWRLLSL